MERYIGCMLCGVRREDAKFHTCAEEVREHGIAIVPGYEHHTHIWTEMMVCDRIPYGKGLLH